MIIPTYSLSATERVLPRLALDFTTAVADPRVATTRAANTATRFNQNGLIEIVNANLPRFDFSPTALTCQGQLIEETRTNLFLNSLIDGTNLSTQSVTLSAVAYTLSFYGSGSVAISGGHSATVSGVGDFPNRKTYTFTPTAGSSTFTVSGDVKFAQLEAGAFATSYIPTTTTSVTRNADVVSMTGTNFSSWYNASEGAIYVEGSRFTIAGFYANVAISDGTRTNEIFICSNTPAYSGTRAVGYISAGGVFGDSYVGTTAVNVTAKMMLAYGATNAFSVNGSAGSTIVAGTPAVNRMFIGSRGDGVSQLNGYVRKILYYPQRLTDRQIQAISK